MIKLSRSLNYWGKDNFSDILKKELTEPEAYRVLIKKAETPGKFINDSKTSISVLAINESKLNIKVQIGFAFSEIQWGYCCGEDEPMVSNSYCEMYVFINKNTAAAEFAIL